MTIRNLSMSRYPISGLKNCGGWSVRQRIAGDCGGHAMKENHKGELRQAPHNLGGIPSWVYQLCYWMSQDNVCLRATMASVMRSTISGAPMSIPISILSIRRTHRAEIHLFEINFH
jgi:hypothetical protein